MLFLTIEYYKYNYTQRTNSTYFEVRNFRPDAIFIYTKY